MGKDPADSFLVVHRFMWGRLGLSGTTLLVFARIYGFCSGGGEFYESKPNTAAFLGISERTVFRAISELLARGLIEETGTRRARSGATKRYALTERALPAHDGPSPHGGGSHDKVPWRGETACHPIRKSENKHYES